MSHIEMPYVAHAVVYECKRCGVPVLSADLLLDAEHRSHWYEDTHEYVAMVRRNTKDDQVMAQRKDAGLAPLKDGTYRTEHDQLGPSSPVELPCWCWKCGRHYSVDTRQVRFYVRMCATKPKDQTPVVRLPASPH